jgi:polysaccharide export outer membrane protein
VSPEELPEAQPDPRSYPLAPEDVVEVIVWKNPDLSRIVTIRPDGKISLPLIGDVQAAGLTAMQLSEATAEKLKIYYQDPPQVSVIVAQINSYAIYILGAVRTPGKHVVKTETTFLQAIALAGDFTEFASLNKIIVRRKDDSGKDISIPMPYQDVVDGKLRDIVLRPGDIIIIP